MSRYSRISIRPPTTPGFSTRPPSVMPSVWRGSIPNPHPPPPANIPTEVTTTVPEFLFSQWGFLRINRKKKFVTEPGTRSASRMSIPDRCALVACDGFRQAGHDERREGECLAHSGFMFADVLTRPGHIHLGQTMHDVPMGADPQRGDHQSAGLRETRHFIGATLRSHALR